MQEINKQTETNTKEQILNVTIEMINAGDVEKVTTRRVAELTGANVGAVNYHFGSKEKLLQEAFRHILSPIEKIYAILDQPKLAPKERLRLFLTEGIKHIRQSPVPLKYYMVIKKITSDEPSELIQSFKATMIGRLINTLAELTGEQNERKVALMALQIVGSIILPNILPVTSFLFNGKEPTAEEQVDLILERII